jgi:hypothetical protein
MTHRVTCRHEGGRIVQHIQTRDHYSRDLGTSRGRTRATTRDNLLEAVAVGKRLALGLTYTGGLKPELDLALDALAKLNTPHTLGNRLEAEGPGNVLDLGKVWDGLQLIERGQDPRRGIEIIKSAIADARHKSGDLAPRRSTGDFNRPVTNAEANAAHAAFWKRQAEIDATPGGRARESIDENERKLAEQREHLADFWNDPALNC